MRQRLDRIFELHTLPDAVAWRLVDTLFGQNISVIVSASSFSVLGLLAYFGTGSLWYLGGFGVAVLVGIVRVWQNRLYNRSRARASLTGWAWRSALGGWAAAAGWGAWSTTMLFEQQKSIVILVAATQGACVLGAAVRHCAVRAIGTGQAFLTLGPLFVVFVVSGDRYFEAYAAFTGLQFATALTMGKFLHQQTLTLLCQDQEKSELLERLETANRALESVNLDLETLAATDALTGVANRRAFDVACTREWRRAVRDQTQLSLLMIDIDHFKLFNDHYGHQMGDRCLVDVAAAIADGLRRPGDLLARYGGEEFAVILPDTDSLGAVDVAADMLKLVAALTLEHEASPLGSVTVSIGAACLFPHPEGSPRDLVERADGALYVAKGEGRNRIHVAPALPHLIGHPASSA